MNFASRSEPKHWNAPRLILTVLSIVALLVLTQCKLSPDKLTGIDKARQRPDKCLKECTKEANEDAREENEENRENVRECESDPVCLAAEESRHQAELQRIENRRKRCVDKCHHQGGGSGR